MKKNRNIPSLSYRWGTTFWGQDSWTKYYVFSEKEQRVEGAHARMYIVKMQLTHDSTFCRGRGYETKSPHLQGTLK